MEKAYKFRLYPDPGQVQQIQRTFGCCRYVFNHFLSQRAKLYQASGITLNYNNCSAGLTALKKELDWLREPDATALQSSLRDLETAYKNFFRRIRNGEKPGFPHFKSKRGRRRSYKSKRVGENIEALDGCVKLPKLGLVKAAISKRVQGRILNATVSQSPSGKYFVSICCTDVPVDPYPRTGAASGVDLGIKTLAVTSDDIEYPNAKYLKQSEKKLAKAQRKLSRKAKGSSNREKARVKVARVQERIANQRLDSIHKMTTELIRGNDVIAIEDLNVKGMVKNRKLAKAISDASWGEVVRQLRYKAKWHGRELVTVGRFFPSSQLCSCGFKNPLVKDLSVRQWICPTCNQLNDRDKNAALNILNEGLRLLAG
jgi:putative transposase